MTCAFVANVLLFLSRISFVYCYLLFSCLQIPFIQQLFKFNYNALIHACFRPQNKDPEVLAGDSLLNYPDVLMEKIPESRNLTEEETQIPCMPVPSEVCH